MSYAFLLNTAIQRDAERVTAQEIRYMAQQLETAMGGIYSLLSQEFQLPLVTISYEKNGLNQMKYLLYQKVQFNLLLLQVSKL